METSAFGYGAIPFNNHNRKKYTYNEPLSQPDILWMLFDYNFFFFSFSVFLKVKQPRAEASTLAC